MSSRIFRAASIDKKGDCLKKSKYEKIRAAFGLEKSKASLSGTDYSRTKPQTSSFRTKGYLLLAQLGSEKQSNVDSEN
jgi:hypothetical protein